LKKQREGGGGTPLAKKGGGKVERGVGNKSKKTVGHEILLTQGLHTNGR